MRSLKRLLIFLSITYAVLVAILVLMENQILYPAPKYPTGNWKPFFEFEDVEFTTKDGVKIHSWLLQCEEERKIPRYFLLCHGNGENVALASGWTGMELRSKLNGNVMVFDYRGYGKSEGSPNEAGLKLDAERALEVLCDKFEIKPSDVILIGHSVGGGPAMHLAATQGCKALIMQKTFSSLPDVAGSKYPWVPVHFLMSNRFENVAAMENYDGPLFQSHGEDDRLIPIRFGEKLFAKSKNPKSKFLRMPRIGHNDGFPDGYWDQVDQWLSDIEVDNESAKE